MIYKGIGCRTYRLCEISKQEDVFRLYGVRWSIFLVSNLFGMSLCSSRMADNYNVLQIKVSEFQAV